MALRPLRSAEFVGVDDAGLYEDDAEADAERLPDLLQDGDIGAALAAQDAAHGGLTDSGRFSKAHLSAAARGEGVAAGGELVVQPAGEVLGVRRLMSETYLA